MSEIATITQDQVVAVAPVPSVAEAQGALAAAISCIRQGMTPGVVKIDEDGSARLVPLADATLAAAVERLDAIEPLLGAATPQDMLAWLCKLRHSVRGAPEGWRAIQAKADGIWEDCHSLPRGVWCDATRGLWRQQPARKDFLPGTQWPLPGELHAVLSGYAAQLRIDADGCRAVIRCAAGPAEPEWQPAGEEERARVKAQMDAHRAEMARARETAEDDEEEVRPAPEGGDDPGPANWAGAISNVVRAASAARQEVSA